MNKLKKYEMYLVAAALIAACLCTGFFVGRRSGSRTINVTTGAGEKYVSEVKTDKNTEQISDPGEIAEKVNINTAEIAELTVLPGIGSALAERIIAYREENGDFASTEGIMNVNGIGETTYERICGMITV